MQKANDDVCAAMEARRVRGGCTMVIAFLINKRLAIAHVGDCRLYLIRGDDVKQLTQDHSLAVALAVQGQITMDQVRDHPDRNMVTRSLGDRHPLPDYFIDTLEQTQGKTTMELAVGDVLLFCSDGLWEPVFENEMLDEVRSHSPDLHAAANAMVSIALERGAPDNSTVLLVRIDETSPVMKEDQDNAQPDVQTSPPEP
jgi:protein phosphatase